MGNRFAIAFVCLNRRCGRPGYGGEMVFALLACALVSDADLASRMDTDGDGVARPGDCDDADASLGAPTASYPDTDGDAAGAGAAAIACVAADGYVADDNDCDDTNADVSPTADEYCNGRDDNCDGVTDEDAALDAPVWYADTDADGYGDAAAPHPACSQPSGFLSDMSDCDDGDRAVYPGAADEWYDGVDGNCDSASDYDADGDGTDAVEWSGSDCDDENGIIHVGAVDLCGDEIDTDCTDGDVGPCAFSGEVELAAAALRIDGDRASAGVGARIAIGDLTADGTADLIASASYITSLDDPGVVVMAGPLASGQTIGDAVARIGGTDGMGAGTALAVADVDGDTIDDVIVGSSGGGAWGSFTGSAAFVLGPVGGTSFMGDASLFLLGTRDGDRLGNVLANAGDVDGDGDDEVLIRANYDGGVAGGVVYLVRGEPGGPSEWGAERFVSEAAGREAGAALAGGADIDGDGLDDMIIGDPNGSNRGAAYVIFGPASLAGSLALADRVLEGNAEDGAGYALALGQLDADGYADAVIVAPYHRGTDGVTQGAAYVMSGPLASGATLAAPDARLLADEDRGVGSAVTGGDLDGNGTDDLSIGPFSLTRAVASTFLTPLSGVLSLADADGRVVPAEAASGSTTLAMGDIGMDGFADLLVGIPSVDTTDADSGAVYVYLGGP